jgi:hypothetical protein
MAQGYCKVKKCNGETECFMIAKDDGTFVKITPSMTAVPITGEEYTADLPAEYYRGVLEWTEMGRLALASIFDNGVVPKFTPPIASGTRYRYVYGGDLCLGVNPT